MMAEPTSPAAPGTTAPSALVESRPIAELTSLDRSLLHLFVCGPGMGEGLALALPGSGWVLVDSCQLSSGGPRPQKVILERFQGERDDPVLSLVLTHPHEDHILGFADLLAAADPLEIAVTGNPPPDRDLVNAVEEALQAAAKGTTSDLLLAKAVRTAIEAIRDWHGRTRRPLRSLRDGEQLSTRPDLPVLCRAPDEEGIRALMDRERVATLPGRANHLSLVLEAVFKGTHVILTGDLPRFESDAKEREVPTGWNAVMERHAHLADHHGLKIPHHGSQHALHPDLLTSAARRRAWVITPFSGGKAKLPRPDVNEGLEILLRGEPSVHLTALPLGREKQSPWSHPGITTRADVRSRMAAAKTKSGVLSRGTDIRGGRIAGPLDAVWCIAFDDAGGIAGRWRGEHALEVVEVPALPSEPTGRDIASRGAA